MREYARTYPGFWTGKTARQLRSCGYPARIIAHYVFSSPHSNMIGLYYLPLPYISYETGIPEKEVASAMECLEDIGFCFYDQESEFIWVPAMARYQIGKELKANDKQVIGIKNLCKSLPENPFLDNFYQTYGYAFNLNTPRASEGASEGPF